jgi:hypothetical protein
MRSVVEHVWDVQLNRGVGPVHLGAEVLELRSLLGEPSAAYAAFGGVGSHWRWDGCGLCVHEDGDGLVSEVTAYLSTEVRFSLDGEFLLEMGYYEVLASLSAKWPLELTEQDYYVKVFGANLYLGTDWPPGNGPRDDDLPFRWTTVSVANSLDGFS